VIKGVKSQVSSLKLIHRRQLVKKDTLTSSKASFVLCIDLFWGESWFEIDIGAN
jgi:hypothetical protein